VKLTQSLEDYLEAILVLQMKKSEVRSVDVAEYLGFAKPSVHRAVKLLKKQGYIAVDDIGLLHLTAVGSEVAQRLYERHQFFTDQLTSLGVDKKTAEAEACKIEHVVSQESFEKIRQAIKKE